METAARLQGSCRHLGSGRALRQRSSLPRSGLAALRRPSARQARQGVDKEQPEPTGSPFPKLDLGGFTRKLKVGQPSSPPEPKGPKQRQPAARPPKQGTQRLVVRQGTQRTRTQPFGGTQRLGTLFSKGAQSRRDPNTVFVAGATGRLGGRIVRELLSQGLRVRAGARDVDKAQEYLKTAISFGLISAEASRRLSIVPVDLTDKDSIAPAIGNAGKVVSAIGASETNLDFAAPKRIDGDAAIALVQTAAQQGVEAFVMVTSLGTGKFGWPAGALNLFGGILIYKRKAEEALEQSGMAYTIVRPGGMERPQDDYKETHNLVLQTRDQLFGGQVSRLQVAELVGAAVANPSLAENKVLEVVAEDTAPLRSLEELLAEQPMEVSQEERLAQQQAREQAGAQIEQAMQQIEELEAQLQTVQERIAELSASLKDLRGEEKRTAQEVSGVLKEADRAERQVAEMRQQVEMARRQEAAAKAVLSAATAAARQMRALGDEEIRSIQQPILYPPTPEQLQAKRDEEQRQSKQAAAEEARKEKQAQAEAKREAEAKAQQEAEAMAAKARQEAEAQEAKAKQQAEAQAAKVKQEAEVRAKQEAEAKAKRQAEVQAKQEAEAKAKREAEVEAKQEAEAKAKQEAEVKAKQEAEAKAAKAQQEAEAQAAKAKQEAEAKAAMDAANKEEAQAKAEKENEQKQDTSAAAQAQDNAAEAAEWIRNWREGKTQDTETSDGAGLPNPFGALAGFRWPWQQGAEDDAGSSGATSSENSVQTTASDSGSSGASDGAAEARAWINAWRARTLEKQLPQNQTARN